MQVGRTLVTHSSKTLRSYYSLMEVAFFLKEGLQRAAYAVTGL